MGARSKDELARLIERGQYKVDLREVAAAMLKRDPLMLVSPQPLDRPAAGAEQDEPAPGVDLA
jgi:hypothetical protein